VVVEELGGEDAGERHLVGFADGGSARYFLYEVGDGLRAEEARSFDRGWREKVEHIVRDRGLEEAALNGSAIGALGALPEAVGQALPADAPEQVLIGEAM
jgi:hypothetical protein